MCNIPVYMVANLTITNADEYSKYVNGFYSLLNKYDGSFITYDDNSKTLEGYSPRRGRMIIFSFPSEQAAEDWYADSEYQALSEHRRAGTKLEFLTMVRGIPPRG